MNTLVSFICSQQLRVNENHPGAGCSKASYLNCRLTKNVKVNFSTDYLKTFIASFFILSLSSKSTCRNAAIEIVGNFNPRLVLIALNNWPRAPLEQRALIQGLFS